MYVCMYYVCMCVGIYTYVLMYAGPTWVQLFQVWSKTGRVLHMQLLNKNVIQFIIFIVVIGKYFIFIIPHNAWEWVVVKGWVGDPIDR